MLRNGNTDSCARRFPGYPKNPGFRGRARRDGGGDEAYQGAEAGVGQRQRQDQGNVTLAAGLAKTC